MQDQQSQIEAENVNNAKLRERALRFWISMIGHPVELRTYER